MTDKQQDTQVFKNVEQSNLHDEQLFLKYYSDRDWNFYRVLLSEVILYAPPGKILDVGGGLGFFIECAMRFGLEAEGIEGSHYAVEQCRSKGLEEKVHEGLLSEEFPYPAENFSTIVINQVIEHLPNQVARYVLRESHRVLKSRGVLILKSPSKFDTIQNKEESHINLYGPSQLFREVEQAGFSIIDRSNACRDFGLGKLGRFVISIIYKKLKWDFLCKSANCIAMKSACEITW